MSLLTTADNPIILDEVTPGYGAAKMKSLSITLRLPVKQMHSDEELRKGVFMPVVNSVLSKHSIGIYAFQCAVLTENESMYCEAKFWGSVDIKAVEKEWNQVMDEYGYTEASKTLEANLNRVNLLKKYFYPPSTFVAEYW
jgi:hypothetical protein